MTQKEALTILKTGANVFLTGEPGSGKTHVLNQYAAYLREHGIEPAITASTGVAATHIGGFTIHSWSGIGIRKTLSRYDLEDIANKERISRRIFAARVLIIDEISMLDGKTLALVDRVCQAVKNSVRPFGGIQVVLTGDFFQLPPIAEEEGPEAEFAFNSSSWHIVKPVVCYLTEQHRQEDAAFLDILSSLRKNSFEERHKVGLETRRVSSDTLSTLSVTKLFPHNADVDRINEMELAKLPRQAKVFVMKSRGAKPLIEQLKRGCLSPEKLVLKKGARVMFTKNNFRAGFVNGTTGEVEGFRKADGVPAVKTSNGLYFAEEMEWSISDGARILAGIEQVPLRLAWAITVHKSQGMSLDSAFMDLSQSFACGQGYVALSRVRTLAGLYLGGLNDKTFEVHPDVLAKDAEFRELSGCLGEELRAMDSEKIIKLHKDFISACGGVLASRCHAAEEKKNGFTYDKTKELLSRKLSLEQMAQERGLTAGTIMSHLEKLVLEKKIEPDRDLAYLKPEQKRFEKIRTAFEALYKKENKMLLSPAREMLGEDFSFEELRLARMFLLT